jgi:DNA-binding MarR family transcriptional regulator
VRLAESSDLDPSRLTRLGGALEKEGLVRRERDPKDNRVMRMYLTAKGREKLKEIPAFSEGFRRRVDSVLNREEQRDLRSMLILLADAMRESEEGI